MEEASDSTTFDYVQYDEISAQQQAGVKGYCKAMEIAIKRYIPAGRGQALAMTNLQQTYMWCGIAIRDEQVKRNGTAVLQEGRSNS